MSVLSDGMRPQITNVVSNLVSFAVRSNKMGFLVIPIVDAGISITVNLIDVVSLFTCYTTISSVWTEGLKNWSDMGVEFSGI